MRKPLLSSLLLLLLFFITGAANEQYTVHANGKIDTKKTQIQQLTNQAFAAEHPQQKQQLWEQILQLDPRNGNAHLQLGLLLFTSPNYQARELGMKYLERAFDPSYVDDPLPMPSIPGMRMAAMLGRYRYEVKDFTRAYYYFQLAYRAAKELNTEHSAMLCVSASMATMLHPFPNTTQQADKMYQFYMKSARDFVQEYYQTDNLNFDQEELLSVPGAADDPYVHCILTLFQLSFYYRADVAEAARLHYQVATTLWPQLDYVSPTVQKPDIPPHLDYHKPCTTRKIQLGIASGFLTPGSSVSADFGGVLQRLDRRMFNVTYIHIQNHTLTGTDPFTLRHPDKDRLLQFDRGNSQLDGAFVQNWYHQVEALHLDVLLYLDLTMNPTANRLAMARLAPVQANSHGHPVTSGISAVDYYISWGAAELEHSVANTHYSEELVLLDSSVPHQYYTPRYDSGVSMMDGQYYADKCYRGFFQKYMPHLKPPFGRAVLVDDNNYSNNPQQQQQQQQVHWYTCMQKPHKFMPEMDPLLCGVLQHDPRAILILHQPDTDKIKQSFERRLVAAQCDLDRVYWFPALPHHELLALYQVSTLILDSYPAGGCTTTREALELSKVVVTLPARLLGGRWSYAYYQIINDEVLNQHVIADTPEEYIAKATRLGKDAALRKQMEDRIGKSLHRLYRNMEAVHSWERALQRISPVEPRERCEVQL